MFSLKIAFLLSLKETIPTSFSHMHSICANITPLSSGENSNHAFLFSSTPQMVVVALGRGGGGRGQQCVKTIKERFKGEEPMEING